VLTTAPSDRFAFGLDLLVDGMERVPAR
jgi:hypothetical protein